MADEIEEGVYTIFSPLNNTKTVHLLQYNSNNYVKYCVWDNGDSNYEKYLIDGMGPVEYKFVNMGSNKVIDIWTYAAVNGTDLCQWTRNNSTTTRGGKSQTWTLEKDTGVRGVVNGVSLPTYRIRNVYKPNLIWDLSGGNTGNGSIVQLYTPNSSFGSKHQRWVLIKDVFTNDKMAVPSNLGLATSANGNRVMSVPCSSTPAPFYIYWECPGKYWHISWTWRGRKAGTDSWSGWAQWQAVADDNSLNGSPAENGWGDPWNPTTTTTNSGNAHRSNKPIYLGINQNTYDKKEIRLCIRQFQPDSKTINHGSYSTLYPSVSKMIYSNEKTIFAVYKPNLSCSDIGFSPNGLKFSLTSDFKRNNNKAAINSITINGKTLVKNFNASGLAYTGNGSSIDIPMSMLQFVPNEGDSAKISVKYSTIDGTWTYNFTKPISYNASHGLTLNPTFKDGEGKTQLAKLNGSFTSSHCWLLVEHDGRSSFVECEKDANGEFIIIPPLGVPYRLFFTAENSSGWGTRSILMPAIKGYRYIIFNWNTGFAVLPWDTSVQWSLERDSNTVQTQGRYFESVFFGDGSSRPFTIKGRLLDEDGVEHSSPEDFEKLSVSDYGVVRFPNGGRYDLAIQKVAFSQDHRRYREVTITGREVS